MKKIILFLFVMCTALIPAYSASRYYTIQQNVPYMYGTIPTGQYMAYSSCDPFMVKIDGTKYYMVFDSDTGYNYQYLLGCTGTSKFDMFTPLRDLEQDGYVEKLTGEELKNAGLRFVALNFDDTLAVDNQAKDYDLSKVSYIDMTRLRFTPAAVGYGNFDLYVKKDSGNLKKIIGKVQMLPTRWAQRMFN